MKIVFTSVVVPAIAESVRNVSARLEKNLTCMLGSSSFGGEVEQLVFVIVAYDSDRNKNRRFEDAHNKVGKLKDTSSGHCARFLSFAIPLDPKEVPVLENDSLYEKVVDAIFCRLENRDLRIPKKFEYNDFLRTIEPLRHIWEYMVP